MEKTIKAWAILDKQTGVLQKYMQGDYMIGDYKISPRKLHKTFSVIPCTITYTLPKKSH